MTLAEVPDGTYPKLPDVRWNLAQERWLYSRSPAGIFRAGILLAACDTCDWSEIQPDLVLAAPERRAVAEFIAGAQHWYECPGEPQVWFAWIPDVLPGFEGWRWPNPDEVLQEWNLP